MVARDGQRCPLHGGRPRQDLKAIARRLEVALGQLTVGQWDTKLILSEAIQELER